MDVTQSRINHFHFDQITTAQLAVYGQSEQSQITMVLSQFKSDPNCPNMLWHQGAFLADNAPLVPSGSHGANGG